MRPLVIVVGLTYADARRYVLANRDARPLLTEAVILSASASVDRCGGLRVHKVIETPAARLGRHYPAVMETLRCSVVRAVPIQ